MAPTRLAVVIACALVAASCGTSADNSFIEASEETSRIGTVSLLPPAPITGRIGPASVWTGTEVLIWGGVELVDGQEDAVADGAAFDPTTESWRLLPVAPIAGRSYSASVWTGTEFVIWGGSDNGRLASDGAAYDPVTDSWRTIATSPLDAAMKSAVAWTGQEMIIVGGLNTNGAAAAYDPVADSWRTLPEAPGQLAPPYPQLAWTGDALLAVLGSPSGTDLAMYWPESDEWQTVTQLDGDPFLVPVPGVDLGLVADEILAVPASGATGPMVMDTFGDIGLDLPAKPPDLEQVNSPKPVWSGREVLFWAGGSTGLALDPVASEWNSFPAGGLSPRVDGAIVWAGDALIAWGGSVSNPDGTATAASDGISYEPPPANPIEVVDEVTSNLPAEIDPSTGCPTTHNGEWVPGHDGVTDYVDFVIVGDRLFTNAYHNAGVLSEADLGATVGQVCFQLSEMTFTGRYEHQPGDAASLPPGTELREITGSDPLLRIAAVDDEVMVYEVFEVADAELGGDALDLSAIARITVNSEEDGETQLAAVDDPVAVASLVDAIRTAPVNSSRRPSSARDGKRYFLELHRQDGTTSRRAYWQETGELHPNIFLPDTAIQQINEAIGTR